MLFRVTDSKDVNKSLITQYIIPAFMPNAFKIPNTSMKAFLKIMTGSKNDKDIVDIGVSYDGSWLTRGHTSNIGVGCVIDLLTGFVIDYEVMSKLCGECEQTKFALEEDSAEFRIWYEGHQDVCSATRVGSSGAMKVNAAVKLWERSESIGFRYTTLLSDGDSKSSLELKEMNVYGSETQIKIQECINHVSKRLGTALRQTVKDWRAKGVTLGGMKRGSLCERRDNKKN
ncbi:uncharacterized protein TNCV_1394951 [Trichonephila clavipes]|nr:uncharacterized protein TNCV_1394951 [Trichonephila clavipes]